MARFCLIALVLTSAGVLPACNSATRLRLRRHSGRPGRFSACASLPARSRAVAPAVSQLIRCAEFPLEFFLIVLSRALSLYLCLSLSLSLGAAVAVSAVEEEHPDDMDIDRTHFEDPALKEDPVATGPHSEIEAAWILPDSQDGSKRPLHIESHPLSQATPLFSLPLWSRLMLSKSLRLPIAELPVGRTNDLLVALANSGSTMFNVTHIEAELMDADGKQILLTFGKYDYGQSLGPREQRSFRFPMPLDKEQALGDYTLVARAYYMSRTKDPFVSVVVNDIAELVPPLPTGEFAKMLQVGLGGLAMLSLVVVTVSRRAGGQTLQPECPTPLGSTRTSRGPHAASRCLTLPHAASLSDAPRARVACLVATGQVGARREQGRQLSEEGGEEGGVGVGTLRREQRVAIGHPPCGHGEQVAQEGQEEGVSERAWKGVGGLERVGSGAAWTAWRAAARRSAVQRCSGAAVQRSGVPMAPPRGGNGRERLWACAASDGQMV